MDRIDVQTAENNYLDAGINLQDCEADRQRHISVGCQGGDPWWLTDLLDHDARVRAARQLLDRRRRELVALKVAA